jgi:hypothetical protein
MDEKTTKKIEQRAYELFVKRGGVHGYHMEDWLRAEREISALSSLRTVSEPVQKPAAVVLEKKKVPAKTGTIKKPAAKPVTKTTKVLKAKKA